MIQSQFHVEPYGKCLDILFCCLKRDSNVLETKLWTVLLMQSVLRVCLIFFCKTTLDQDGPWEVQCLFTNQKYTSEVWTVRLLCLKMQIKIMHP